MGMSAAMSFKPETCLQVGQAVKGRWNGRLYQIIRPLGAGANGKVYLVLENGRKRALKMSSDPTGIALEFRLLKQLQRQFQHTSANSVRGLPLGPFVSDLDDTTAENGQTVFFYAMEYIAGVPASRYAQEKGEEAVRRIVVQLLRFLRQLHDAGYAFGDLKAENVLVNPLTGRVCLVDFGGATRFGEGIRQYTEWYDRAYWHKGSRRADHGYDLFALAMLIVQLLAPDARDFAAGRQGWAKIKQRLAQKPSGRVWLPLLEKAWRGEFGSALEMYGAVMNWERKAEILRGTQHLRRQAGRFYRTMDRGLSRDWDWSHWTVVASAVLFLSVILRLLMIK